MNSIRAVIAFAVLCFSSHLFAANCTTNLYFINGVGYGDASDLTVTVTKLKNLLKDDTSICVKPPLFNQGEGLLGDVSETYALKFVGENGITNSFLNIWQGWMAETIQVAIDYFSGKSKQDVKTEKQLDDMTAIVKADVDSGKKVIIIGHSEGNLFAKEIARRINSNVPTGVPFPVVHFGVAVPTTMKTEAVYSNYLTASTDKVISLVSNSAPPNFISNTSPDPLSLNHDFLASYLNEKHTGSVGFMDDPSLRNKQNVDIQTIFVSMVKRVNTCFATCTRIWFS